MLWSSMRSSPALNIRAELLTFTNALRRALAAMVAGSTRTPTVRVRSTGATEGRASCADGCTDGEQEASMAQSSPNETDARMRPTVRSPRSEWLILAQTHVNTVHRTPVTSKCMMEAPNAMWLQRIRPNPGG